MSLPPLSGVSKSTRGNERLEKEQYTRKVHVQLENLFKPIVSISLSFLWFGRNMSG